MRILGLFIAVIVCLVGCGSPSLAGKWNMTGAIVPLGSSCIVEFMASTFTTRAVIDQDGTKIRFEFSGDYTYDGKKLKLTGKSINVDELSFPPEAKSLIEPFKASLKESIVSTQEGDAKLDGDVLVFTVNGKTTTFTKIK